MKLKNILKEEYGIVFSILFTTGLASMVYEIVFISMLSIYLGATEQSTSLVIGSFLGGLAIGSMIGGLISQKDSHLKYWLIGIELGIAVYGASFIFILGILDLLSKSGAMIFAISVVLVSIPAILMGMEIPISVRILNKTTKKSGFDTGFAYSSDTIGGIIGSMATGLIFIPSLGLSGSLFLGAALNVVTAGFATLLNLKIKIKRILFFIILITGIIAISFLFMNSTTSLDIHLIESRNYYETEYYENTPYQRVLIEKNPYMGKSLKLNEHLQITEHDSTMYHEFLIMPAFFVHPNPKKVLIIGGGDGGALYQVTKFNVTEIDMVDLDERVIEISKKYLASVNKGAFEDERLNLIIDDGRKFISDKKGEYDIIIVDLPDPSSPQLALLYTKEFYELVYDALKDDGIMVTQETPASYYMESAFIIENTISSVFENTAPYWAPVNAFGNQGYVLASKKYDPKKPIMKNDIETKWYLPKNHEVIFVFHKFLEEARGKNELGISTDNNPIIYKYAQPYYYVRGVSDVYRP